MDLSLGFSENKHKKQQLSDGKGQKCLAHGGNFYSLKVSDILKNSNYKSYSNVAELKEKLLDPLNEDFGAECYCLVWKKGSKYVTLKCKVIGCNFSIWFTYEGIDADSN